jgi:hypothetical protein
LYVINVSDPGNPFIVGSCNTPGSARGVYIDGNFAYLSDGWAGIHVLDISDPEHPLLESSYDTPGSGSGAFVDNGYVYLADKNSLMIFELPPVGVNDQTGNSVVPSTFHLEQNFPNPFNAKTAINYQLPHPSRVRLEVFDLLGRKVVTLVDGRQKAGYWSVSWEASKVSSGIYFYKLTCGDFTEVRRMTVLK